VLSDEEDELDEPKPIFHDHLMALPSIETASLPRDSMQYKSDGTDTHLVLIVSCRYVVSWQ